MTSLASDPGAAAPGGPAPADAPAIGASLAKDYDEQALCFDCEGDRLVGVLAHPNSGAVTTGVLLIVGGPQYRAGSHRHFVQLARGLASAGWPTLRFDVRGMGDSSGNLHRFEQITPDVGAAIDAFFQHQPGLQRVVLWGLCDAASAALLYMDDRSDPRVAGLVLLNPWVRSAETFARAQVHQYYARQVLDLSAWRALAGGRISWGSIVDFAKALRNAYRRRRAQGDDAESGFQHRMARAWRQFGGPTLLVLSSNDLTAREFVERLNSDLALAGTAQSERVSRQTLADADHTLSSAGKAETHLQGMMTWLRAEVADSRAST